MRQRNLTGLLFIVILTSLAMSTSVWSAKGGNGNGGGKPGGGDPPTCEDIFPGFVYVKLGNKKTPDSIYLASSDGCDSRHIITPQDFRSGPSMHVTGDGSRGVILWTEEPDNAAHHIVKRISFSIDDEDSFVPSAVETILPRPLDDAVLPQDHEGFRVHDIWGNADHSELFMLVYRYHWFEDGSQTIKQSLIYNMNSLDEKLHIPEPSGCEGTSNYFPQFVAECYRLGSARWNEAGDRLYWHGGVNGWMGGVRADITKGATLNGWSFSSPELIYTGSNDATYGEPSGVLVRPLDPTGGQSQDEQMVITHLDRSGNNTVGAGAILNADYCVSEYELYADGETLAPNDLWFQQCRIGGALTGDRQLSWQSSDALLVRKLRNRNSAIFRVHYPGSSNSFEELLIEGAESADSGL